MVFPRIDDYAERASKKDTKINMKASVYANKHKTVNMPIVSSGRLCCAFAERVKAANCDHNDLQQKSETGKLVTFMVHGVALKEPPTLSVPWQHCDVVQLYCSRWIQGIVFYSRAGARAPCRV